MSCLFCKIVKGVVPCEKIFETKNFLAFLDINPVHPGHALVIPKKHVDYLFDLSDEETTEYFLFVKRISSILKNAVGTEKVGLVVEGFLVRHAHAHLIPINDGMSLNPKEHAIVSKEELKKIGENIRKKARQTTSEFENKPKQKKLIRFPN